MRQEYRLLLDSKDDTDKIRPPDFLIQFYRLLVRSKAYPSQLKSRGATAHIQSVGLFCIHARWDQLDLAVAQFALVRQLNIASN